jgi:hypothetical protein
VSIDEELDALHVAMDRLLDRILDANSHLRPAQWTARDATPTPPRPRTRPTYTSLGRRVAQHHGDKLGLFDDPTDDA